MKADNFWHGVPFVEVAMHRFLNHQAQFGQGIGFGENGFARRPGDIDALRCLFHKKNISFMLSPVQPTIRSNDTPAGKLVSSTVTV